jgi:hypothetical protein
VSILKKFNSQTASSIRGFPESVNLKNAFKVIV